MFLLHQDFGASFSHELLSELEDLLGESCAEEGNLDISWDALENLLDVLHEATVQHLISFIDNEKLEVSGVKEFVSDHIDETTYDVHYDLSTWSGDDDVNSLLALVLGLCHGGSSDAAEELDVEELTDSLQHVEDLLGELSHWRKDDGLSGLLGWVDPLEGSDDECTSLSGT